jgi:hypothetical protein
MRVNNRLMSVAMLATLVGCAQPEFQPLVQCDMPQSSRDPASGPALVAREYGRIEPLPLNSILYNQPSLTRKVVVQSLHANTTATGTLQVQARLVNCTRQQRILGIRTHFMNEDERPVENPSAWQQLFLPPGGLNDYSEMSMTSQPGAYLLEIRDEGR